MDVLSVTSLFGQHEATGERTIASGADGLCGADAPGQQV
jgi:hypothetical protein